MNEIFNKYTYGLYLLSSGDFACIIDTACQVSSAKSEDVYISVSINNKSDTCNLIKDGEPFAVSVLSKDTPKQIVNNFGFTHSSEVDKFKDIEYIVDCGINIPTDYIVNYVICQPVNQILCGTHTLIIGKVVKYKVVKDTEPLTYNDYKNMD